MRRALWLVAASTVVCCTGACAGASAPPPVTHTVRIEGAAFVPATLAVRAGDTIIWTNKDPYPHTVTSRTTEFDSGTLQPDGSWKLTPAQGGERSYICTLHPTMAGTFRVE